MYNKSMEKITQTENRDESSKKIIKFIEKASIFETTQKILSDNQEFSFDDFKYFLNRLNGQLRNIPVQKRVVDGNDVYIGHEKSEKHLPPKNEDKLEILEKAFSVSRNISIEDTSYLLPLIVNECHLYADGNGRTSRFLHQLIVSKSEEELQEELKIALGDNGRFASNDISSLQNFIGISAQEEVLQKYGWDFSENANHEIIKGGFYSDVEENEKSIFLTEFNKLKTGDTKLLLTSILDVLGKEKYHELLKEDTQRVSTNLLLKSIDFEIWEKIRDKFYEIKKESVFKLIDYFENPERNLNNNKSPIKEEFKKHIKIN